MRLLDPIQQEDILDKTYVTVEDIYHLYPLGRSESKHLFSKIRCELVDEGIPLVPCRPAVVPLDRVLAIYPINQTAVRRAAKRKRMCV